MSKIRHPLDNPAVTKVSNSSFGTIADAWLFVIVVLVALVVLT